MELLHIISLVGFTLDVTGKIIIGYTALVVHKRMIQEHKIDDKVVKIMKIEYKYAIAGICMIILGYFMQLPLKVF